MIYWAYVSFTVALTSGLFGFGGQATIVAGVAQTLFFVFLGVALVLVAAKMAHEHDSDDMR